MSDLILHEHCSCTVENLEHLRIIQEQSKTILKLHDLIASADMRSRLAFGESREANELVDKNQKDIKFLLGIKTNYKNKTGGINV